MIFLFGSDPQIFAGRCYWSLSPVTKRSNRTTGGIPISVSHDTEYFRPLTAFLLRGVMTVPNSLTNETDPHVFYQKTLVNLLEQSDLSFISVWSPTFLLQLDSFLKSNSESILAELWKRKNISRWLLERTARLLTSHFAWDELWPRLRLVSCWTDGEAALWLDSVKERLGAVEIQGKGLISTEGFVSFPIGFVKDTVLSLRSHFFEVQSISSHDVFLLDQLGVGDQYEEIITTAGGLYRYQTGNVIKVTGYFNQIPCCRFQGRISNQSDLVGEKLSEHQVIEALKTSISECSIAGLELAFLYPVRETAEGAFRYLLFVESKNDHRGIKLQQSMSETTQGNRHHGGVLSSFKDVFEHEFRKNPYYDQAINLGQLKPIQVQVLPAGFKEKLVNRLKEKRGTKDGVLKISALYKLNSLGKLI